MINRQWWLAGSQMPVAIWLLLAIGLAILVRWLYRRSYHPTAAGNLWWIRFATITIILIALMDLNRRQTRFELPDLVFVVDQSGSMLLAEQGVSGTENEPSRYASVVSVLTESVLNRLSGKFNIVIWTTGSKTQRSSLYSWQNDRPSPESESRLGDGLQQIVRQQTGRNTAAIILVSDGAVTSGLSLEQASGIAARQSIPVFTLGCGSCTTPENIRISNLTLNQRARTFEPVRMAFELEVSSHSASAVEVCVTDQDSEQVLATRQIQLDGQSTRQTVQLDVVLPDSGIRNLLVRVEPLVNEVNLADNQLTARVQVFDQAPTVLIVQDLPSAWFRFLKQALLRSTDAVSGRSAFDVQTFLQQAASNYRQVDTTAIQGFPSEKQLEQYDIVVIGDVRLASESGDTGLSETHLRALANYVTRKSGNVVFVPGPVHMKSMLQAPVLQQFLLNDREILSGSAPGNGPDLNGAIALGPGPSCNTFLPTRWLANELQDRNLAPLYPSILNRNKNASSLFRFKRNGEGGDVMDAITLQPIGNGTVITHLTDELFKLNFRTDDDLFQGYWSRLVTQLASQRLQQRDKTALITAFPDRSSPGEGIQIIARVFDENFDGGSVQDLSAFLIDAATGRRQSFPLRQTAPGSNRFEATVNSPLNPLVAGNYQVNVPVSDWLADSGSTDQVSLISTDFQIRPKIGELDNRTQQVQELKRLADETGGHYRDISQTEQLLSLLPYTPPQQAGIATMRPVWVWPFVPLMFATAIICLLVLEWWLRMKMSLE